MAVLGEARRVRIAFVNEGRPSGAYYYQTRVDVLSPTQVRFAE